MVRVRKAEDRGRFDFGWLDTRHTFSFGDYYDPAHMGFRALRVINEDRVKGGEGFPTHPHRDMEILTWGLEGGLAHRDSTGTGSTLRKGELQRMSAGTGVLHSEMNASETEPAHFLQIWIQPETRGLNPEYEQKAFDLSERAGQWVPLANREGAEGALTVHQDVRLFGLALKAGQAAERSVDSGRSAWVQVARGEVTVNGEKLEAGDGAALEAEPRVRVQAERDAELLLFDLA